MATDRPIVLVLWSLFVILSLSYSLIQFISLLLSVYLNYLEDEVRWIHKESRLLKGISNDVDEVKILGAEIVSEAHQFWDSESNPSSITLQLNDVEADWVITTKNLANEAKSCCATFYQLRGERSYLVLNKLKPIFDLVHEIKRIKIAIHSHLQRKRIYSFDICESLTISRSKIRSLRARCKSIPLNQSRLTESFKEAAEDLIKRRMEGSIVGLEEEIGTIFSLVLVHAFLKDLSGLQLESVTERAWWTQAKEIIDETEQAILQFNGGTGSQLRWFPGFGKWIEMYNLKKKMKRISAAFVHLLDRKDSYGFKFISRSDASRSHRRPLHKADDTVISTNIRLELQSVRQTWEKVHSAVPSLCNELDSLYKIFKEAMAAEVDLYNSRYVVCSEQIKNMAQIAADSIKAQRETPPRGIDEDIEQIPLLEDIEQIKRAIVLFQRSIRLLRVEQSKEYSTSVVGLEEDIHEVVSKLIETNVNNENASTVSIVGMKGIGKTTLAKEIYYHRNIENHFAIRAWIELPREGISKAKVLLTRRGDLNETVISLRRMGDKLREISPCLLVVDKITSKEEFNLVRAAILPERADRITRILLTTRYKTVALHEERSSIFHQLRLRTKEESWELFKQMVTLQTDLQEPVVKLAEKVVGRCGGLPLAILSLGYLLSGKDVNEKELERALERINQGNNQTPWIENKEKNYGDLINEDSTGPSDCHLSYLRLFPRDFEIPARRLITLWVAEGLVSSGGDAAEKSLQELIDRNMIQVVERKPNGKPKTCRLPNSLRELFLRDNGQTTARSWSLSTTTSLDQRFGYHFDEDDKSLSQVHDFDTNYVNNVLRPRKHPLSILFFDIREGNKPGEDIGCFLHRKIAGRGFRKLKVLDLEGVFRPQLPNSIGDLIELRYLGLRWTHLQDIPSTIGKLLNLHTLDLKHTNLLTLPKTIWKLQKLQHLYLDKNHPKEFLHYAKPSSLLNLQTLRGVYLVEKSPLIDGLDKLTNLRNLKLKLQLTRAQQQNGWQGGIDKLKLLRSLKLRSIDSRNKPQNLYLGPLSTLEYVSGSFIGVRMVCSARGFPQLLVLKMWRLEALQEWEIQEQALQNLMELDIRHCQLLEVPTGLNHIKTLQKLKLKGMQEVFTATIAKNQGPIWDDISQSPIITIT
ncbi:Disease resistance protein [Quillaja saponaria]|uniref:Disease resistance protein n=1 Tax=Quillaja saponaria TaxID=32244 RepID=A0AAD7LSC6_QUISA|nr:Disease resistance protein [Quillaja saponaria]